MKRSEMNEVLKARLDFSMEFEALSTKETEENPGCEPSFSRTGCDICPDGKAGDVYNVVYLARADIEKKIFDNVYEGEICGGCLCSQVNGDDSDLDYHTDDEDCEPLDVDRYGLDKSLESIVESWTVEDCLTYLKKDRGHVLKMIVLNELSEGFSDCKNYSEFCKTANMEYLKAPARGMK